MSDAEEQGKKMGQIIAKAWADDSFKERLLNDAPAVLKEEGVEVTDRLEVRAVENAEKLFHLVLPPRRPSAELSDEDLATAAGGRHGIFCWNPWKNAYYLL